MTAGRLYLAGTAIIGGVTGWVALHSRASSAPGVWLGLGIGLVVQAPLGWWLVRSLGTERFLGAWVAGILTRFALVGVTALVVLPGLGWPLAPGTFAVLIVLLSFLLLEVIVLLVDRSRTEAR